MDISAATEAQLIAELKGRGSYIVIGITTPNPSARSVLAIYRSPGLDTTRISTVLMQAAGTVESCGDAAIT